ncbi:conserved protein of unknown function [Bradyrhizobium vignae]|uniref:Uncharacterized protein n=2 Tax=Bradyrhizobium vignae TaxID=1549949 RepID=A0A2U3Q9N7_9BRAD|nr:conserved protein of unknown function [Bradyrhizobium vignae]
MKSMVLEGETSEGLSEAASLGCLLLVFAPGPLSDWANAADQRSAFGQKVSVESSKEKPLSSDAVWFPIKAILLPLLLSNGGCLMFNHDLISASYLALAAAGLALLCSSLLAFAFT